MQRGTGGVKESCSFVGRGAPVSSDGSQEAASSAGGGHGSSGRRLLLVAPVEQISKDFRDLDRVWPFKKVGMVAGYKPDIEAAEG